MRTMRRLGLALPSLLLAGISAQGQGTDAAAEAAYLRAAGEHFGMPESEVVVLTRWSMSVGEIPVVLFLARRAGVSPDVVVAKRRQGSSWMAIAATYSVHAGDFHVQLAVPPGNLAGAYEQFNRRPVSEWGRITLADEEVLGLVNLGFLSRSLGLSPETVAAELGRGGSVIAAFQRLRRPC